MSYQSFEDLEVWKRACQQAVNVLKIANKINNRRLADQMSGSCISVPSNIAEGHGKDTPKDFRRYLNISQGSNYELKTQLYISQKMAYITKEEANTLIPENTEISAMIRGLITSLNARIKRT